MQKIAILMIGILSCLCAVTCGSGSKPVEGSCPVDDFNGNCCIRQADCNLNSGNPEQDVQMVQDGCHRLDPMREPLLCLNEFNTNNLPDCIPLNFPSEDGGTSQYVEACMGTTDLWDGKEAFFYNVYCCK